MCREYHLRSPLDVHGKFWVPGSGDSSFTGRLWRDRSGLKLTTSPILRPPDPRKLFGRENVWVPVLNADTTEGPCTLLGLQSPAEGGREVAGGESIVLREYRVGLCVAGMHIQSSSSACIPSAYLRYSGLEQWIPNPAVSFCGTDEVKLKLYQSRDIFDFCSTSQRARISLTVKNVFSFEFAGGHRGQKVVLLSVEPSEPKSVEWFVEIGNRVENFFSLALGRSVVLRALVLHRGEETGYVIRHVYGKPERPDPSLWVQCDGGQLGLAMCRWLSTPEEFRQFENLVYWTVRKSQLFPQTEFLCLAQALESLHRLTDDSTITAHRCFKEVLRFLRAEIAAECGNSPLGTRLNELIANANEPSFRARIESLMRRVPPEVCQRLVGDPREFEQRLRQTRNYFTHPGIERKSSVLADQHLFLFNQKLHALLRLLMLIHIGFSAEQVINPVLVQATQWR